MPLLLRILTELRRQVLIRRRAVAALCAGIGTLAAVHAVAPAPPASVTVWALARDVPVGARLARDDVRAVRVPVALAPQPRVRDPARLLGRVVVTPLRAGQPLLPGTVLDERGAAGFPGRTVTAVRLAADVVRLLHPGDRIDLWATGERSSSASARVAHDAVVVAVPDGPEGSGFGGGASASGAAGAIALVAVASEEVGPLATAGLSGFLTPAWDR